MGSINIQYYKTPYGELVLGAFAEQLCLCDWRYRTKREAIDNRLLQTLKTSFVEKEDEILVAAKQQLNEYFNGQREMFDIPLLMAGTDFQKSVWHELVRVPYGVTISYLELAERINNKQAVRAVASANGANGISIFVPCHRIIGSNGQLTGYAGGLSAKQALLELESRVI